MIVLILKREEMKEGIAKNLARVTSALFNVLMGDGVVLPSTTFAKCAIPPSRPRYRAPCARRPAKKRVRC